MYRTVIKKHIFTYVSLIMVFLSITNIILKWGFLMLLRTGLLYFKMDPGPPKKKDVLSEFLVKKQDEAQTIK